MLWPWLCLHRRYLTIYVWRSDLEIWHADERVQMEWSKNELSQQRLIFECDIGFQNKVVWYFVVGVSIVSVVYMNDILIYFFPFCVRMQLSIESGCIASHRIILTQRIFTILDCCRTAECHRQSTGILIIVITISLPHNFDIYYGLLHTVYKHLQITHSMTL